MMRVYQKKDGFALPTILIASVMMLIVLIAAVSSTGSVRTALDGQYYSQLAREAAESGLANAQLCLQSSGYVATWSNTNQLRPDTDCTGANPNGASKYIISTSSMRNTFTVAQPVDQSVSQIVTSVGMVERIRASSGLPWRTYTYSTSARVGVDLNLNTVSFGYVGGYGAYFATIAADGTLRAVGYNGYGQLGNGTFNNTLTPTLFTLNGNDRPAAVFANFLSGGYNMFVLTDKGTIYGAGYGANGQLGNGSTTTYQSQAVQFGLPAGKSGKYVSFNGRATYVLTTDSNIYSAGSCGNGSLGYTYTIAGCTDQSAYQRVALPTPIADTNTQPTNNIVTDSVSAFARMIGGRVYGWGGNFYGELVTGNTTDSSTPLQIGTYGNASQPKATGVSFDGDSVYIVDDSGAAKAAGRNDYGQLAGDKIPIFNPNVNKCIDNVNNDGLNLQFYACLGNVNQQFSFRSDGSIYYPSQGKCLDNNNGDGVNLRLWSCNGLPPQRFVLRDDGSIYNQNTNTCLDNNGNGAILKLYSCNGLVYQNFTLPATGNLVNFVLPSGSGTPVKTVTDQWFASVLTSTGQVWSAGANNKGQLGNGATSLYQPFAVKFILPAGVTAVDVYNTAYQTISDGKYNNTFVVGSDGKVYGAGSNVYGQLGDGTTTDRSTPVAMQVIDGSILKAQQVQSGDGTTVILTTSKKIYTVGNNSNGQLGDGTTTNSSTPKANRYTNILPVTTF